MALGIVVTPESACIDGVPNGPLASNHTNMNKFLPGEDNYVRVKGRLDIMVLNASAISKARFAGETYGDPEASYELARLQSWLAPQTDRQWLIREQLRNQKRCAGMHVGESESNTPQMARFQSRFKLGLDIWQTR